VIPKHLLGVTLTQRYRAFLFNFDLNRTGSYIEPVFENNLPFRTAEFKFAGFTKGDVFVSYERRQTERGDVGVVWRRRERLQSEVLRKWFPRPARPGPRWSKYKVLILCAVSWLRLQGFRVSGRECVTYETRPCNLKAKLSSFRKQPAGEKDNAEQYVNAVIRLAQVQWTNHPHAVRRCAERQS